jgi:hypothetical protein
MASYITTAASTKLTANSEEDTPQQIPLETTRAHTVEEWELGIPPDPTSRSGEKPWFKLQSIIVFNNCATTQPVTELTNI